MTKGTYTEFRDALRAFESGWDRERYETGVIADWQLDAWAGGPVTDFHPQYSSWGDLTEAEWAAMSYRSTNSLGFVGYQFGEALLIDLGYYDDDLFYGNGAATNTWDGSWTGKNGVTSLEDFMTGAAQEIAIQEAFGYNLKIITEGLANSGQSLDDFLGTTASYVQNGETVTVELTLTGIMAAAHLRGAYGTLALLQGGAVSTDEYGTSILRYIDQFGGYDAPSVGEAIAFFDDRVTGDEGLGTPGESGGTGGETGETGGATGGGTTDGFANAAITEANATVAVTWAWGQDETVTGFDPAVDTIFFSWVGADALEVSEEGGSVVFAIPSNNQRLVLDGVTLADLDPGLIHALDATAREELAGLISGDGTGGSSGETGGETGGHGGHGGMAGTMTMITLTSLSRTIDGFHPATDMIHVEAGITGERFEIFEESGDALGLTTRIVVTDPGGAVLSTTIFTGVGLADLTLANFSVAEQSALNEVAAAIGAVISTPASGGYTLSYDSDGSNPPQTTGATEAGGVKYRADTNADDIIGFDPTVDELDFGGTSVHGMIVTKSAAGEIVIDSPWSDAAQIVQGVTFQQVTIDTFGIVGNEHFRQDIGGVVSWEKGIGPREPGTVYVRSHEYGVAEVIDGFDPATDKISFLYFGTRERLSVEDTADGLVISSLPTGQSVKLTGVTKADLVPGRVEFHHDQVMEDNLEVPFGFAQDAVTLVDRTVLLTPAGPEGATTDGYQTRDGLTGEAGGGDGGGEPGGGTGSGAELGAGVDIVTLDWSWGTTERYTGFDPAADVIDFGTFEQDQLAITEAQGDLVIEVLGNGGDFTVIEGIQAEDLGRDNLTAPGWSTILDPDSDVMQQLIALGYDAIV